MDSVFDSKLSPQLLLFLLSQNRLAISPKNELSQSLHQKLALGEGPEIRFPVPNGLLLFVDHVVFVGDCEDQVSGEDYSGDNQACLPTHLPGLVGDEFLFEEEGENVEEKTQQEPNREVTEDLPVDFLFESQKREAFSQREHIGGTLGSGLLCLDFLEIDFLGKDLLLGRGVGLGLGRAVQLGGLDQFLFGRTFGFVDNEVELSFH